MLLRSQLALLKAAQETLVAANGGQHAAAGTCGFAKSTVGRWADTDDPTLMHPLAMLKLQNACGKPIFAEALALASDLPLAATGAKPALPQFMSVLDGFSGLTHSCTEAFADQVLTVRECDDGLEKIRELKARLDTFEASLAEARAGGGAHAMTGAALRPGLKVAS